MIRTKALKCLLIRDRRWRARRESIFLAFSRGIKTTQADGTFIWTWFTLSTSKTFVISLTKIKQDVLATYRHPVLFWFITKSCSWLITKCAFYSKWTGWRCERLYQEQQCFSDRKRSTASLSTTCYGMNLYFSLKKTLPHLYKKTEKC